MDVQTESLFFDLSAVVVMALVIYLSLTGLYLISPSFDLASSVLDGMKVQFLLLLTPFEILLLLSIIGNIQD
ncbi:hypothetical protein KC926_00455 [Candidatus Kaiserbacteria bacterium]|nr:hypothetical protein [Candidatus Kaiserbacteria bacterium]